jgi:hypothetical protein
MSGGSFDYAYQRSFDFADRLLNLLDTGIEEFDHDGTESKLREIAELAIYTSKLMKEVEWYYSFDISEETFLKRISKIDEEFKMDKK